MKTITTNKGSVKIYSSAKELTIERYTEFQKYLTLSSGIGSDMESILNRLNRLEAYILDSKKEDSLNEITNLKNCLNSVLTGVPYQSIAFAVLVAEINGLQPETGNFEAYQTTLTAINEIGISYGEISDDVEEVKKKF